MESNESFPEYLYCMLGFTAQANVDVLFIMGYIINGIRDTPQNKVILYGFNTVAYLKERFCLYRKIKSDTAVNAKQRDLTKNVLQTESHK